jgi:hypothetical protein
MTDTNIDAPAPEPSAVGKIARVPKHRRRNLAIAFGLYYLIAIWLAWFVYVGSTEGMAAELGEATGALAILALIAAVITIWIKSNIPFYIAIALACAANLSGHMDRIKEAMEAHTYRGHEMADATLENYRDKLAHSQTQLGQVINSVSQIIDNVSAELGSPLVALNDQQLMNDVFDAETLSNREKRNGPRRPPARPPTPDERTRAERLIPARGGLGDSDLRMNCARLRRICSIAASSFLFASSASIFSSIYGSTTANGSKGWSR